MWAVGFKQKSKEFAEQLAKVFRLQRDKICLEVEFKCLPLQTAKEKLSHLLKKEDGAVFYHANDRA